jgi:tRNA pseudouridine38-40 synthase
MPRYRAIVEYDGTPFVGWQAQARGVSVQGRLTEAITAFTGEVVTVRGAGRTDSGVHARGQVCHFDLAKAWPAATVRDALNFHLKPDPVAVVDCTETTATFDARFSAVRRHYLYRIICRRAPLVLERDRAWRLPMALDVAAMQAGAAHLVGRHDFTTYRAAGCQAASPVKTLDQLQVQADTEGEVRIAAVARSFLHNQVRSMVGSLKLVGEGRWEPADMGRALEAKDRSRCGPVAPPQGLYLMRVDYPDPIEGEPPPIVPAHD